MLAAQAAAFLSQGGDTRGAELFGTFQGRIDLRGLTFEDPFVAPRLDGRGRTTGVTDDFVELDGVHLANIDLSHSRLRSFRFFGVAIENCVFDQADCTDWRMWNTHVRDSSFLGAKMRGSALAALAEPGPVAETALPLWTGVCFDGADLRDTSMSAGAVNSCTFERSKLDRATFENVSISDCRFTGSIKRAEFFGYPRGGSGPRCRPMTRVDFSEAHFVDVTFRGCRFVDVQFPEDQRLLIVEDIHSLAPLALPLLAGDSLEERIARALIENVGPPDPSDSTAVFEAVGEDDPAFDLIAQVLERARTASRDEHYPLE